MKWLASQKVWSCWLLLCSTILCSQADSLRSHVILHEWIAFYCVLLNIHQSGVLAVLVWLVPHETAAISVSVLWASCDILFSVAYHYNPVMKTKFICTQLQFLHNLMLSALIFICLYVFWWCLFFFLFLLLDQQQLVATVTLILVEMTAVRIAVSCATPCSLWGHMAWAKRQQCMLWRTSLATRYVVIQPCNAMQVLLWRPHTIGRSAVVCASVDHAYSHACWEWTI